MSKKNNDQKEQTMRCLLREPRSDSNLIDHQALWERLQHEADRVSEGYEEIVGMIGERLKIIPDRDVGIYARMLWVIHKSDESLRQLKREITMTVVCNEACWKMRRGEKLTDEEWGQCKTCEFFRKTHEESVTNSIGTQ